MEEADRNKKITRNIITNCNVTEENNMSYESQHPELVWIQGGEGRLPRKGCVAV